MKMTELDKLAMPDAKEVTRRSIYELLDKDMQPTGRYALVVIGSHRNKDNYVSIIKLTDPSIDNGNHRDEVGIRLPSGQEFWVHCGMITYIARNRLGDRLYHLSKQTMQRVNKCIQQELGLVNKPNTYGCEEPYEPDYKKLYEELLTAVSKGIIS